MTGVIDEEALEAWLSGTVEVVACGNGRSGPSVQVSMQDGRMVLLEMREVGEAYLRARREKRGGRQLRMSTAEAIAFGDGYNKGFAAAVRELDALGPAWQMEWLVDKLEAFVGVGDTREYARGMRDAARIVREHSVEQADGRELAGQPIESLSHKTSVYDVARAIAKALNHESIHIDVAKAAIAAMPERESVALTEDEKREAVEVMRAAIQSVGYEIYDMAGQKAEASLSALLERYELRRRA